MTLLGPVFWHDLVNVARRHRWASWRAAFAIAFMVILAVNYGRQFPLLLWTGGYASPRAMADFTSEVFGFVVVLSFSAVILLTPGLTASALSEEKSHNTLIFLLTTQLTSREIILGKLMTRMLQIGSIVLSCLPLLAILQFLGGIDFRLAGYLAISLIVTGFSLGALGILVAVLTRRPQNSGWRVYQILLAYCCISVWSIWYFDLPTGSTRPPLGQRGVGIVTLPLFRGLTLSDGGLLGELIEPINFLNPVFALRWANELERFSPYGSEAAWLKALAIYSGSHLLLATIATLLAIRWLRWSAARSIGGASLAPKAKPMLKPAPHPPIRNRPVLWKELYCEFRPRKRWWAMLFSSWFFYASFLPAWITFLTLLDTGFGRLADYTFFAIRVFGTLIACGLIIRLGVQAGRSIGLERDRETFDSLASTDLRPEEIVDGKWLGAFLSGRWVLLWLIVHWLLGVLAFTISIWSVPLLTLQVIVYAAFAVSVGLCCSAWFPRTRRAVAMTLLILIVGSTVVPWLGAKLVSSAFNVATVQVPQSDWTGFAYWKEIGWPELLMEAVIPPQALANGVVPFEFFHGYYFSFARQGDRGAWLSLVGLIPYLFAVFVFWKLTHLGFRRSLPGHRQPEPISHTRATGIPPLAYGE